MPQAPLKAEPEGKTPSQPSLLVAKSVQAPPVISKAAVNPKPQLRVSTTSVRNWSRVVFDILLVVSLLAGSYFYWSSRSSKNGGDTTPADFTAVALSASDASAKGDAYLQGNGVTTDPSKAAYYYQLASDKNHAPSTRKLAALYLYGSGVKQDSVKAYSLNQRAASGKEPEAILAVARAHRDGLGVSVDPVASYAWFTVAMNFPAVELAAKEERTLLARDLNKTQLSAAIKEAKRLNGGRQ